MSRSTGMGGVTALLVACVGAEGPPTVNLVSPQVDQVFAGSARIPIRVNVRDDKDSVTVDFFVNGEVVDSQVASGCRQGCFVSASVPSDDLADGEHEAWAEVSDLGGHVVELDPVRFSVHDVPYVHSIAVSGTREGVFEGPGWEVEVHLLHDATAQWLGCAPLTTVQQDALLYTDLRAPFIANQAGELVLFRDVGLEVVRVVVIESDGGEHCPIWPDLGPDFESGADDLYGMSPPIDLSLLFSAPIQPSVPNVTGLEIRRGRPL